MKGLYMNQKQNEAGYAAMQLATLKRQIAVDNFCNSYARLATPERRKVKRILQRLLYRKTGSYSSGSYSYWDRWTKDDMRECDLRLRRISPRMANLWRRWAFPWLKAGLNNLLVLLVLVDSLDCRMWEESLADFD